MKTISALLLLVAVSGALMSASVSPVAPQNEGVTLGRQSAHNHLHTVSGAIKILTPQKDLESAIRTADQGDILLYGAEGWYRLDGKALKEGTKVYVLGEGSLVSVFPKEAETNYR